MAFPVGGAGSNNGLDLRKLLGLDQVQGLDGQSLDGKSLKELMERLVQLLGQQPGAQGQPQGGGGQPQGAQGAQGAQGKGQNYTMEELEREEAKRRELEAQRVAAEQQLAQVAQALMKVLHNNPEAKAELMGILAAAGVTLPTGSPLAIPDGGGMTGGGGNFGSGSFS